MKNTILSFFLAMSLSCALFAQSPHRVDLKKAKPYNCKVEFHDESVKLINASGKTALLWIDNNDFHNGVIELDLKGKDVRGQSFLGVAFHALNDSTYSAIYFRPFNFKSPDRKTHSVQYIDLPGYDWDLLRDKYTDQYENEVKPVPDPNDWFHAKIVVNFPEIKVYVDQSEEPSLVVKQISNRETGKIGLWLDCSDGWFRNLQISNK